MASNSRKRTVPVATDVDGEEMISVTLPSGDIVRVPAESVQIPDNWGRSVATLPQSFSDEESDDETPADRLAMMLRDAAGDSTTRAELKVYRVENGQLSYCQSYEPTAFENGSFDMLRSQWGPGEYELRLYATHPESGRFVVRAKPRVKIAEMPSTAPAAIANNQNNELREVMKMMLEAQQKNAEEMRALIAAQNSRNPLDGIKEQLSLMTMMREAMGLNTPQAQQKSSIAEIVDAIKELRGAAELVSPHESNESETMKLFGTVAELVKNAPKNEPHNVAPVVSVPASLEPAQQNQPETADMNMLQMIALKAHFANLMKMAETKAPISEAADFLYEKLPDEMMEILALENWFEVLLQYAPECKPHQQYLNDVRAAVLAMLDAP